MISEPTIDAKPRCNGLIFGCDDYVAAWARQQQKSYASHLDACVGIVTPEGVLVGAFAFNHYNGSDAEIHFYGPGTLTKGVVGGIFTFALQRFNPNRLTVRTRKPSMARGVLKLGAIFECRQKRVYGPTDADEHAASQFVFYREQIERLAILRG